MKNFLLAFLLMLPVAALAQVPPPPAASVSEVLAGQNKTKFISPYVAAQAGLGTNVTPAAVYAAVPGIVTNYSSTSLVLTNTFVGAAIDFGGDSISSTNPVTGTNVWVKYFLNGFGVFNGIISTNFAVPGDQIVNMQNQYPTNGGTFVHTNRLQVSIWLAGINDTISTSNQIIAAFTNLSQQVRAQEKKFFYIVPYNRTTGETAQQSAAFNIIDGIQSSYADYFFDARGYFNDNDLGDGLHLTDDGAKKMNQYVCQTLTFGNLPILNNITANLVRMAGSYVGGYGSPSQDPFTLGYTLPSTEAFYVYSGQLTADGRPGGFQVNVGAGTAGEILDTSGNVSFAGSVTAGTTFSAKATNTVVGVYGHITNGVVTWTTSP
ncbi:MAG: SGNH/GDSL hydrolase family protein [Patescibacteria group bacterium]|nr:SGNH/GDSL hydrolase family protein [Patescibacteria group bacterium]